MFIINQCWVSVNSCILDNTLVLQDLPLTTVHNRDTHQAWPVLENMEPDGNFAAHDGDHDTQVRLDTGKDHSCYYYYVTVIIILLVILFYRAL